MFLPRQRYDPDSFRISRDAPAHAHLFVVDTLDWSGPGGRIGQLSKHLGNLAAEAPSPFGKRAHRPLWIRVRTKPKAVQHMLRHICQEARQLSKW